MKRIITIIFILIMALGISACARKVSQENIPLITGFSSAPSETTGDGITQTPSTTDSLYIFNKEEVKKAIEIADQYLKDLKMKANGALEYSKVKFDPADPVRKNYRVGINSEEIIVFRVDLNVAKAWDGFDAIEYKNWAIIVTRKDKDSNWEFKDAGY